jgi:hypothetical protein
MPVRSTITRLQELAQLSGYHEILWVEYRVEPFIPALPSGNVDLIVDDEARDRIIRPAVLDLDIRLCLVENPNLPIIYNENETTDEPQMVGASFLISSFLKRFGYSLTACLQPRSVKRDYYIQFDIDDHENYHERGVISHWSTGFPADAFFVLSSGLKCRVASLDCVIRSEIGPIREQMYELDPEGGPPNRFFNYHHAVDKDLIWLQGNIKQW